MLTSDPSFEPPFCPRKSCRFHHDATGWRWVPYGTFERKAAPHVIRRFKCLACRRTFSTQTFDTTYFLKKPHLQKPIFHGLVACSGFRQLGRSLGVAGTTVERQASRLGRHCLLFEKEHGRKGAPTEALVLDGLVSFEYSQYWPFETNVLVGSNSYYAYAFTESELRRSGRMTAGQKARRRELEDQHGVPDGHSTRDAVRDLIRLVSAEPVPLHVLSDEHAAYPRAFRLLPHRITHETVSSRRCRTWRNLLFAADLLDLMVRHGGANHKRETIAFSKRRQGSLERMAVTQVWRNFMKRKRERDLTSPTPAQVLGLRDRALTVDDVLDRRLFPSRVLLPAPLSRYYWRDVETRQIPNGTRHALKLAA